MANLYKLAVLGAVLFCSAVSAKAADLPDDPVLKAVIASPDRTAKDRARDIYRHPEASLRFWGLRPGMTVIELQPEGGYWAEILAPYIARTGGTYLAGVADPLQPWGADVSDPNLPGGHGDFPVPDVAASSRTERYGVVRYVPFGGAVHGPLAPPGSVDWILSAREVHNWIHENFFDEALKHFYDALKPGGILAIEEHRADSATMPTKTVTGDITGYVDTQVVIDAARRAGFILEAASEINANPQDSKDYPFGVWTLKPGRLSVLPNQPALTDEERRRIDAIGESDRMTLRFRKPG